MQCCDVLKCCSKLLGGGTLVLLLLLKSGLHIGQGALLVRQRFGVVSPLVSRVFHELLVISLGILLLRFG